MRTGCTVVLDVGKTNAKLTLWDGGERLGRRVKALESRPFRDYRALDAEGVEAWMAQTLAAFSAMARVSAIIPVGHGAGAALISGGKLFAPVMDYEQPVDAPARTAYDAQRDAFADTGSPALPLGLNLGVQLDRLEALTGPWPADLRIVPWPQYWAWRLSSVAASEVSSLGCHSDLWRPNEARPTDLAIGRGWAGRMAPLRRADERLGPVTAEWARRTGLPADCVVLCGLHDSNAALLAARGHPVIADHDATVLSTGTWFVAMRSPDPKSQEPVDLPKGRDCLINVDIAGRPVPSAQFMGGREFEILAGPEALGVASADSAAQVVEDGVFALPSFVPGVGPFPDHAGRWAKAPASLAARRAATDLYLALMTDACLDLIGSRDRLLIEGRFAESEVFVRAVAALRPDQAVFVSNGHDDVPYGALRLVHPELKPVVTPRRIAPLSTPLNVYRSAWRAALKA